MSLFCYKKYKLTYFLIGDIYEKNYNFVNFIKLF